MSRPDEELVWFYRNELQQLGYTPMKHYYRVGTKTLDLLCEKDKKPVIVEVKRNNISLKMLEQVEEYRKVYREHFSKEPEVLVIGETWTGLVQKEAERKHIQLMKHLANAPNILPRINIVLEEDNDTWIRNHIHGKGDISNIINEAISEYIARREEVYITQCDVCGGTTAHYRGECLEHREESLTPEQDLALNLHIGKLKRELESSEMAQARSEEEKRQRKEKSAKTK